MRKVMSKARVRINSSDSPLNWYANEIGEEFDVIIPANDKASYVVDDSNHRLIRHIHREDAVIIDYGNNRSTEDLIASLASEVAQLKRDVRRLEENTKTFAETATEADRSEERRVGKEGQTAKAWVQE